MNDAALGTIARNVRAARTAAGLSFDALARRADVGKGALVALEGAGGNPALTTLVLLAEAFGLPVTALMQHAGEEPLSVVDAEDVAPLWTGPSGGTVRLLVTGPRPAPVEIWRWQLHPGERHESNAHQPGGDRDAHVSRGTLLLVVSEAEHTLPAGRTTAFAADVPHAYEGAGRGPCELLMTVHLPRKRTEG